MTLRNDTTLAQTSYSFLDLIGQTPLGFPISRTLTLFAGVGVPSNNIGNDGDYYFRKDGGVGTHIYFKSGGVWAGIV